MRAVAADYADRPDLLRLFDAARRRETPRLRKWLAEMIPAAERDMRRSEQQAEQHRRAARQVTAAWWQAARWCAARPSPLPAALVFAPTRESLAHRASYLPRWVELYDESAEFYRRRLAQPLPHRGRRTAPADRHGSRPRVDPRQDTSAGAKETPMFPDREPSEHAHLDADPRCICAWLRCGGYLLDPGCPMHGMTSGRTFTWHYAHACPDR